MTKEEWIKEATEWYMVLADLDELTARGVAESTFEDYYGESFEEYSPTVSVEDDVREELTYWAD